MSAAPGGAVGGAGGAAAGAAAGDAAMGDPADAAGTEAAGTEAAETQAAQTDAAVPDAALPDAPADAGGTGSDAPSGTGMTGADAPSGTAADMTGPPAPEAAAHGPRYALGQVSGTGGSWATGPDLLPADRLLDPGSQELDRLLTSEYEGSGHRTAHAAALTLIAVYAGRVTAAAVLQWALDGRVPDLRAENVLVRPSGHGIGGVWLRRNRMLTGAATAGLPAAVRPGAAAPAALCGHVGTSAGEQASARPGPGSSTCLPCFRAATLPLLHRAVLDEHLLPLADALHRRTRAGLRQLRGGVAHGCATALCASQADPDELALRWDEFSARAPGGIGQLGEVARVRRPDGTPRLVYLRRTCCLYYTSAEAVRCASCCLTGRAERLRAYAARA
ncbi:(2Fe-2S)-binding protein [Streptomyces sp. NPDC002055]|uniref:(2Fe-2S)-binding protein n=1 Tax=Streptomyces sp. NPDC002055 TaxID=3154534 RepID=UPI003316A420